jgi:stage II sporulation protein D
MEALKAQAIVCRTYAVYQMQENKSRDFDVTSDIYSQVYGGKTSERYRTNEAVDATKGQILTYQDKVFPAYFHATCAGHTEDAAVLWNIDIAPLKGVVCNYCKDSPHFNWHLTLDRGELRQRLVNAGYKMGMIKNIEILGKNKSGRITNLNITTTTKDVSISAKAFRNIVGPNEIRSTNFTVNLSGDDLVFEGFGWGHGVGLCQWGAYFMATQGKTAEQILKFYYPQSNVKAF